MYSPPHVPPTPIGLGCRLIAWLARLFREQTGRASGQAISGQDLEIFHKGGVKRHIRIWQPHMPLRGSERGVSRKTLESVLVLAFSLKCEQAYSPHAKTELLVKRPAARLQCHY